MIIFKIDFERQFCLGEEKVFRAPAKSQNDADWDLEAVSTSTFIFPLVSPSLRLLLNCTVQK